MNEECEDCWFTMDGPPYLCLKHYTEAIQKAGLA